MSATHTWSGRSGAGTLASQFSATGCRWLLSVVTGRHRLRFCLGCNVFSRMSLATRFLPQRTPPWRKAAVTRGLP